MEQNRVINPGMTTGRDPDPIQFADRWQHHSVTQMIDVDRGGWLGAWDAIVAALLRRPRLSVAQPVTLSVWLKVPNGQKPKLSIIQTQLETRP